MVCSPFFRPKKNRTTKNLDATLHSFSSYVFLCFGNEEINTHTKLNLPPSKKKKSSSKKKKKKKVGSKENLVDMGIVWEILPFFGGILPHVLGAPWKNPTHRVSTNPKELDCTLATILRPDTAPHRWMECAHSQQIQRSIRLFPKIGGSFPQNGWFIVKIMEKPDKNPWMIWGYIPPYFWKHP